MHVHDFFCAGMERWLDDVVVKVKPHFPLGTEKRGGRGDIPGNASPKRF